MEELNEYEILINGTFFCFVTCKAEKIDFIVFKLNNTEFDNYTFNKIAL